MRPLLTSARALLALCVLGVALAGCGKALPKETGATGGVTTVAAPGALAANGLETKNTTRLGGTTPVADAAAVALAVHPGLTPATRPAAVVLVDAHDWPAALASAALAAAPLSAPILYAEGNTLPAISEQALHAMRPRGSTLAHGAQVIEIGTSAAPATYRVAALASKHSPDTARQPGGTAEGGAESAGRSRARTGGGTGSAETSAALAAQIERLIALLHGAPPRQVILVAADGPPALAMPAAGLAAETGAPILTVTTAGIPRATRRVLASLRDPAIYVVGGAIAVSDATFAKLGRYGAVHRIAATPLQAPNGGESPASGSGAAGVTAPTATTPSPSAAAGATPGEEAVANAIAVARYSDGSFGWGVEEPGHGLVFANAARPLDAPAAAPLSASGDFGPLLLLEGPRGVPQALSTYLSDIQPSYPEYQPTRGFYNHGWLVGDEAAIAASTQAELDTMLETQPHNGRER